MKNLIAAFSLLTSLGAAGLAHAKPSATGYKAPSTVARPLAAAALNNGNGLEYFGHTSAKSLKIESKTGGANQRTYLFGNPAKLGPTQVQVPLVRENGIWIGNPNTVTVIGGPDNS